MEQMVPAQVVLAGDEHSIIKLSAQSVQRLEGVGILNHQSPVLSGDRLHGIGHRLTDAGKLAAGDHGAVGIDHTDGAASALFQL